MRQAISAPRKGHFPDKKRRAGWEERLFFIHFFGGFRKPPKKWAFLSFISQSNRADRKSLF